MKLAVLYLTRGGQQLARVLAQRIADADIFSAASGLSELIEKNWTKYDGFVFIMAAGIVVRTIAPHIRDKRTDPAVVVVDEKGRFAISLLSGHLGGANDLAEQVADVLGGQAVITTASDTLGLTAIDTWAKKQGLIAENPETLTRASAVMVNTGRIRVYFTDKNYAGELPSDFLRTDETANANLIVSNQIVSANNIAWPSGAAVLRPENLVVGVGCNRGTPAKQIYEALLEALSKNNLSSLSIRNLASIDLKKDEPGLLELAEENGWKIRFYSKDELNKVPGISRSEAVLKATGAVAVAEPAALLSAEAKKLIVGKMKWKNVTIAIAQSKTDFKVTFKIISKTIFKAD